MEKEITISPWKGKMGLVLDDYAPRHVLIIFPYTHLDYSPTIINLCRLIIERGLTVKVVYGISGRTREESTVSMYGVVREQRSYPNWILKLSPYINFLLWKPLGLSRHVSFREYLYGRLIQRAIQENAHDELVVIDAVALYCASKLKRECHFVSLEIDKSSRLIESVDRSLIHSVLIQSAERLRRLFKLHPIMHHIVQNAPTYNPPKVRSVKSNRLIYAGAIWRAFGAHILIDFIRQYPQYELTLHGPVREDLSKLLLNKPENLRLNEIYLQEEDLDELILGSSIGLCLYDFEADFIKANAFNYATAPSGKFFKYLSLGIPVIATRVRAFQILEDYDAGVLVQYHAPETINAAIEKILANYQTYSDNALELSRMFCFRKNSKRFIDSITGLKK